MRFKRFLAVFAACAAAAGSISVQAGAAGRFRLLTEPVSAVGDGVVEIGICGDSSHRDNLPFLYADGESNGISGLFDITAGDLDSWRETGEFSFTRVESDLDFDRNVAYYRDQSAMCYLDEEGNLIERLATKYDGKGKLDIIKRGSSEDVFYYTYDGWLIERDYIENGDQSTLALTVTSPDGKTFSKDIQYDYYRDFRVVNNDKYLGYIMYSTGSTELPEGEGYDEYIEDGVRNWDVRIDALTKEGELENIYSGNVNGFRIISAGDNYFMFRADRIARSSAYSLFFPDTGEQVRFNEDDQRIDMSDYQDDSDETIVKDIYWLETIEGCHGDNIILSYAPSYSEYGPKDSLYRIGRAETYDEHYEWANTDISISDTYKHISTEDGELYLVQTLDDKWGYMNADGELLATYDDAGAFMGRYAPVVKDGKAFLINRDLKRVSEKIDAESVATLDKGLYRVTINGEWSFMTYAAAQQEQSGEPADTSEPSKPEEPAESSEPEQPGSSPEPAQTEQAPGDNSDDKANPETGAASGAAVLAAAAVAAGAVLLSRKRR